MLKKLIFTHNVFMDPAGNFEVTLKMDDNYRIDARVAFTAYTGEDIVKQVKLEDCKKILDLLDDCALWTWNKEYHPEGYDVLDGFGWDLVYEDTSEIIGTSQNVIKVEGSNAYPWCFYKLIRALIIAVPELKDQLDYYVEEKQPVYGY